MELFTTTHQNYHYNQLFAEIETLPRDKNESIADFDSRIMQNYYRFDDDDQPSKEYFDKTRKSLIHNSLMKVEKLMLLNELD